MINQELRSQGIGGSEIAALCGHDKKSTPFNIWNVKINGSDFQGNNATKAGILLEPLVADLFENENGIKCIIPDPCTILDGIKVSSPDRYYDNSILEIKTTGEYLTEPMTKWYLQLQWYLGNLGKSTGAIAWIERKNMTYKQEFFSFDSNTYEMMVQVATEFWENFIIPQIPPPPTTIKDFERIKPEGSKEIDDIINLDLLELQNLSEQQKTLDNQINTLKDKIKLFMGEAEYLYNGDKKIASWKQQSRKSYNTKILDKSILDSITTETSYRVFKMY